MIQFGDQKWIHLKAERENFWTMYIYDCDKLRQNNENLLCINIGFFSNPRALSALQGAARSPKYISHIFRILDACEG